jgi:hypothetical protein
MKFKVGDKVRMTRLAIQIFNTKFQTGVIKKIGSGYFKEGISVKRDNYKGHEYAWWDDCFWKKENRR